MLLILPHPAHETNGLQRPESFPRQRPAPSLVETGSSSAYLPPELGFVPTVLEFGGTERKETLETVTLRNKFWVYPDCSRAGTEATTLSLRGDNASASPTPLLHQTGSLQVDFEFSNG